LLVYLIYSSWSQIVLSLSKVWAWLYTVGILNQFRGIFIALIILLIIGALFIRSHHEFLLKKKTEKVNKFKWKTFFKKHGKMIKLVSIIVLILLVLAVIIYLIYFYFSAISSFFSRIWSWLFN